MALPWAVPVPTDNQEDHEDVRERLGLAAELGIATGARVEVLRSEASAQVLAKDCVQPDSAATCVCAQVRWLLSEDDGQESKVRSYVNLSNAACSMPLAVQAPTVQAVTKAFLSW